jgi:phosphoribosylaminoimidazole carboxylase
MFLLEDDTLLLCELASRIHNSGHYTIEACSLSQFDTHLRAILNLPIPLKSLKLRQPAIMLNILGGSTPNSHLKVAERALSIPNVSIHLCSKGAARPGWKMGHITIIAPTMHQAETMIQPLIDFINNICVLRTNVRLRPSKHQTSITSSKPPPTIGVMMGSDSDLKTLIPGLKLLKYYFGIEPDVDITSAHRTPTYMAEFL